MTRHRTREKFPFGMEMDLTFMTTRIQELKDIVYTSPLSPPKVHTNTNDKTAQLCLQIRVFERTL